MPLLRPPSGAIGPPEQRNQPSRKGKKAWRKHVHLGDIETGLEVVNQEIIQGGVITEKASSELFALDIQGDASLYSKIPKQSRNYLKADGIISQRSAVGAVIARKRARPEPEPTASTSPKRQRTAYVSHKELIRLRQVADGHHAGTIHVEDAQFDVWDSCNDVLPVSRVKRPESTKRQPVSLAAHGKPVPAVKKPAGWDSYNPAYSEYSDRLTMEGNRAVEAEKNRLAAEEADKSFKEAAAQSAAEVELAEARAELSEWDDDSAWEGLESGPESTNATCTKRVKRKTQAQRNRIRKRKAEEGLQKHEASVKAKQAQLAMVNELIAEIEAKQLQKASAVQEHQVGSASETENNNSLQLRRKQLGKFRLPDDNLELILPDELQDSLRMLKPEGNLLKDRYRSLLIRGAAESRKRRPFSKKRRTKSTEKWGHKDFTLW